MTVPYSSDLKGDWQQRVGARIFWGIFENDELIESKGHAEKLAAFVADRYLIVND